MLKVINIKYSGNYNTRQQKCENQMFTSSRHMFVAVFRAPMLQFFLTLSLNKPEDRRNLRRSRSHPFRLDGNNLFHRRSWLPDRSIWTRQSAVSAENPTPVFPTGRSSFLFADQPILCCCLSSLDRQLPNPNKILRRSETGRHLSRPDIAEIKEMKSRWNYFKLKRIALGNRR